MSDPNYNPEDNEGNEEEVQEQRPAWLIALLALIALAILACLAFFVVTNNTNTPADPTDEPTEEASITICHYSGSETNPYVELTILESNLSPHDAHASDIIPKPDEGCPGPATAEVTDEPTEDPKIDLCHASGSESSPYILITTTESQVALHEAHDGDIIPAPADGCPAPTEEVTSETTEEPTDTPTDEPTPVVTVPVTEEPTAESFCGDSICQSESENSDICPEDCGCTDNGIEDPGEGCNCKDVVCEGEEPSSACGSSCTDSSTCANGLSCSGGVCWDACTCGGDCGEPDPEPPKATCVCKDTCGDGCYDWVCSDSSDPKNGEPCEGGGGGQFPDN